MSRAILVVPQTFAYGWDMWVDDKAMPTPMHIPEGMPAGRSINAHTDIVLSYGDDQFGYHWVKECQNSNSVASFLSMKS
eukprot:5504882-Amphidinium_carterae.1